MDTISEYFIALWRETLVAGFHDIWASGIEARIVFAAGTLAAAAVLYLSLFVSYRAYRFLTRDFWGATEKFTIVGGETEPEIRVWTHNLIQ